MKRYLWVGGLVLAMNAYSADNPFDLAKNMQKIEAEDTMLLDILEDELKSQKKDDIKSDDFVVSKPKIRKEKLQEQEIDITSQEEPKTEEKQVNKQIETKLEEISETQQQEPQEEIQEKVTEEKPTTQAVKIDKTPVVEEMKTTKEEPIETNQTSVATPKANIDVQKPQVEETTVIPAVVLETEPDVQVEPKKSEVVTKDIVQEPRKVSSVADINITKEKEEMALKVQRELEEAIKDVDRED